MGRVRHERRHLGRVPHRLDGALRARRARRRRCRQWARRLRRRRGGRLWGGWRGGPQLERGGGHTRRREARLRRSKRPRSANGCRWARHTPAAAARRRRQPRRVRRRRRIGRRRARGGSWLHACIPAAARTPTRTAALLVGEGGLLGGHPPWQQLLLLPAPKRWRRHQGGGGERAGRRCSTRAKDPLQRPALGRWRHKSSASSWSWSGRGRSCGCCRGRRTSAMRATNIRRSRAWHQLRGKAAAWQKATRRQTGSDGTARGGRSGARRRSTPA